MAVQVSYPGVYVVEEPSGVQTITGVSTSVAMFIGEVQRGPYRDPTLLLSYSDYERSFGDDTTLSEMTDQVRQFFLNGGREAYVMRTANGATQASVDVANEFGTDVIRFLAAEHGSIGSTVRIEIDYDTPRPESSFNLRAYRLEANSEGDLGEVETETIEDLSMNPSDARYAVSTLESESSLVRAEDLEALMVVSGYSIAGLILDDLEAIHLLVRDESKTTFKISVDSGGWSSIVLKDEDFDSSDYTKTDLLESSINTHVAPLGVGVSVSLKDHGTAGKKVLVIQSSALGGSVRIQSATSNDLAASVEFGVENGGVEVGGYAACRPAPTGLVTKISSGKPDEPLDLLATLGSASVDSVELKTSDGATLSATLTGLPTPLGADSLRGLQAQLTSIASQINADRGFLDASPPWSARRYGMRLALSADTTTDTYVAASFELLNAAAPVFGNGADDLINLRAAIAPTAGLNGGHPELGDYTDAFEKIRSEVDIFNLMILPKSASMPDGHRDAVWGPASAFCYEERAFLLIDPPMHDWTDASDVRDKVSGLRIGLTKDHAAVFWPKVTITDPSSGVLRDIDPAGSVAGVASRTDGSRGLWKAFAGLEASILGARGVSLRMSDQENGVVNPVAVNAIRQFPDGVVLWGARTVDGYDTSANSDYKYIPVRRMALHIEESLYRGLRFAVFQPNDEPLWARIRLAAGAFMNNLFRQGAFQGQKSSDAYFVKCDSETTTQNDINLGVVNVIVGFAPLLPAEFVVLTIRQMAGEVTV